MTRHDVKWFAFWALLLLYPELDAEARHLCGEDECAPTVLAAGLDFPDAISLHGGLVYWSGATDILSVPKAGGPVAELFSGQTSLTGLVTDGSYVYWTTAGPLVFDPAFDGVIARGTDQGTGLLIISEGGDADPFDPSIGGGWMYWADFTANRVRRMELSTRSIRTFAAGEEGTMATAADAVGVVWIDYFTGLIRYSLHVGPGVIPVTLAADLGNPDGSTPYAVALSPDHVYWVSNNYPGAPGHLRRVPRLAPFTVEELGEDPTGSAVSLSVDGTHVYWVVDDVTEGRLLRTPIGGGTTTRLLTHGLFAVAQDATRVYVTNPGINPGEGEILSLPKTAP